MLTHRVHWHNASERDPFWEARLVWFADTKFPRVFNPDDDNEELQKELEAVDAMSDKDVQKNLLKEQIRNRYRTKQALAGTTATTNATADTAAAQPAATTAGTTQAAATTGGAAAAGGTAGTTATANTAGASASADPDAATVSAPEAPPENLKALAEKFKEMKTKIEKLAEGRIRPDIAEALNRPENAAEKAAVDAAIAILQAQRDSLSTLQGAAERMDTFLSGDMPPQEFRIFLTHHFADQPAILQTFDTVVNDPAIKDDIARWNAGALQDAATKIILARRIWDGVNGPALKKGLQETFESWEKYFNKTNEAMTIITKEVDKKAVQEQTEKTIETPGGFTSMVNSVRQNGVLGMKLYSVNQWISAVKKVHQAYTDAYNENDDQKANELAFGIGNAIKQAHLPLGDAINRRLGSTLESDFGKKKNEYKEELGDDDFNTLYSKFHDVRSDPAKAIAVLEAASDHGWLYELSDLSDDPWPARIFGVDFATIVPPHWDETQSRNYLGTLTRKNTAGGNEERGKGKDRIKEQQDVGAYIRRFDSALKSYNYWQAIGVMDALIDRAKTPEVSELMTLKVIQHLRTDPNARIYLTAPVLEQFGNQRWGEATYAQNMITMSIPNVVKLKSDNTQMKGALLATVDMLEKRLHALDPDMPASQVQQNMAKIMAGQTIQIGNEYVSIFEPEFAEYWGETTNPAFPTYEGTEVTKTAMDYFKSESPLLLLPSASFRELLRTGSTGQFDNESKARHLIGQAVLRMEQLKNKNPSAAAAFRKLMHEKFMEGLKAALTNNGPKQIVGLSWQFPGENEKDEKILAALVRTEIVSIDDIANIVKDQVSADAAKTIRAEIEQQITGKKTPPRAP